MACSNGDYNTNAGSVASSSANPLNQLDSAGFNWTGTDPLSAKINGQLVVFDSATTNYSFSLGVNAVLGIKGIQGLILSLKDVYGDNIYNIGYQQYTHYGCWYDTLTSPTAQYVSYNGNVGQVLVLRNDTRFIGKFYFQGKNAKGELLNVSEGWFNVPKP